VTPGRGIERDEEAAGMGAEERKATVSEGWLADSSGAGDAASVSAPLRPMAGVAQPSRDEVLGLPQLRLSRHPLVAHKLTLLRRATTDVPLFRRIVAELTYLLSYEATADLPLAPRPIETPLAPMAGARIAVPVAIIPILRAGLGMIDGFLDLMPQAHVWHIGLYRDERTLRPVSYYNKVSESLAETNCLVLDPMLATGGSAIGTVDVLKRMGARRISFVGLVAAPYGVRRLTEAHPDVAIHAGALDERLNDAGFIVPGLGDAGDRLFATGGHGAAPA
jgi:uracil phosphoribosyltransferase